MYCANCGGEIKEGDKFCRYCGSKVETPNSTPHTPYVVSGNCDYTEEKTDDPYGTIDQPKGKEKAARVLSIVAYVMAWLSFGFVLYVGVILGIIALSLDTKGWYRSKSKAAIIISAIVSTLMIILLIVLYVLLILGIVSSALRA